MTKNATVTLTIAEVKEVRAIVKSAETLGAAAVSLHQQVAAFLMNGADSVALAEFEARAKLMRKADAYKAASEQTQATVRKAAQRVKDQLWPNRERKSRGAVNVRKEAKATPAAEKATKPASVDTWGAFGLKETEIAWAKSHEAQVFTMVQDAIRAAMKREVEYLMRNAA